MTLMKRVATELSNVVRETGQAIDRLGLAALEKPIFKENLSRHRPIMNVYEKFPTVTPDVFVAPNASIIGHVAIATQSSVWYGAVIRGDLNNVNIGSKTSIGDRVVITTARSVEGHVNADVDIGSNVTIGAGSLIQSATIGDGVHVGAGSIILEGAVVEDNAKLLEGTVVHPLRRIPSGQVWAGNPAQYVRDVTETEIAEIPEKVAADVTEAAAHAAQFLPVGNVYVDAEKKNLL